VIPKAFGEGVKKVKADLDLDASCLFREHLDTKLF